MQSGPKYALEVAKKMVKARKADKSGGSRADTEGAERKRFALELSVILKEACMPVVYQIEQLHYQNLAWERIFGSRRAKTLRNRFRAWSKYRMWLIAFAGVVWPREISDLVNYVEEMLKVGAPISLHGELRASLVLLEQVGRVPGPRQLSRDGTWKSHLSAWDVEQDKGSRPHGSAQPYTVAVLIELELTVCNTECEFYRRVVAWIMLIASWACMRVDDVQRVVPESLRLSTCGFSMKMARSKTRAHFAPSCGTASRSRERPLKKFENMGFNFPKPLRSDAFPLGLPNLEGLDKEKVLIANQTYKAMIEVAEHCLRFGIAISVENPGNSFFWKILFVSAFLNRVQGYDAVFHHCVHGGLRDKLTRCMVGQCGLVPTTGYTM